MHRANGGVLQPGCYFSSECDHLRALKIFRSSLDGSSNQIKNNNVCMGEMCKDKSYIKRYYFLPPRILKCKHEVVHDYFGIHSKRVHGVFDFDTLAEAPYAIPHFAKQEEENTENGV